MTAPGPPRNLSCGQKSQWWTTGCSLGSWILLLDLRLSILHPQFPDIYGSKCTCMWEKKWWAREKRKMSGRTYATNESWGFPPVNTCYWAILASKSKSSGANPNCPVLLLEIQLFPLLSTVLFEFWFKKFFVWLSCCFRSKEPLSEGTVVGQAFEKRVTSAKSLPGALGMSAAFGTGEYSAERYFGPQAVIPFAVKRKERCCKCFISRESMVPVSSDVLFILLY